MRRRRSVELRSAQLSRHKELLREYVDETWFTDLGNLAVPPTIFTTSSEVDGECLRISFEYLRLRCVRGAFGALVRSCFCCFGSFFSIVCIYSLS